MLASAVVRLVEVTKFRTYAIDGGMSPLDACAFGKVGPKGVMMDY
jgi:hypothetical protein